MVTPINKRKVTEWSHIDENMTRRHACKFKDGPFNIVKILMSKRWILFLDFEETYPYFYTLKRRALQAGPHRVSVYLFPEAKFNVAYCRVRLCNTCRMIERLHYHLCNSNVQVKNGTSMHLCGNIKMLPGPSLQSKHRGVGDAASLTTINMVSVANVSSLTIGCITGSAAWCPQRQIAHWVHPPV